MIFRFCLLFLIISEFARASVNPRSCVLCHTAGSVSIPTIQGQNREYFEKQMFDFKFRNRLHPKMNEIASAFSAQDIAALADFFARSPWTPPPNPGFDESELTRGRELAERMSCTACHGQDLLGFVKAPRLAGQKYLYLESQLKDFHAQRRTNDLGQMFSFVQFLTAEDMRLLALYLNSL